MRNAFEPCPDALPDFAEMRLEEAQAMDVMLHLLGPELVVETGTFRGGSATIWARHADVITLDPKPSVEFTNPRITQVIGNSPHDLDELVLPLIKSRRWIFFHDSIHDPWFLLKEIHWAFNRGAICALWHDVALNEMGKVLDALRVARIPAQRLHHFGLDVVRGGEGKPDVWQGLGLAWNN